MLSGLNSQSCGLYAHQLHILIINKVCKHSDGIGAAAHTGYNCVRQSSDLLGKLFFCLSADAALEFFYHLRIRVRSYRRPDDIKGILSCLCPGTDRFIGGILQRVASRCDRYHLGTKHLHAKHI